MNNNGRFLAGVAAIPWRPTAGRYLLLRRSATKDFGPGTWKIVTGRVDQGGGARDVRDDRRHSDRRSRRDQQL